MGAESERSAVQLIIVDDDLFVRTTLVRILGRQGGLAVAGDFGCGADAVEFARLSPPDVALVDIGMDGMDGVETTRQLRQVAPNVKVLALTSLIDEAWAAAVIRAGASGFLTKDCPVPVMVHSIVATAAGLSVLSGPAAGLISTDRHSDRPELSDTELAVLRLLAQGQPTSSIAEAVFLSQSTVKYHIAALMTKLEVSNRVMLAVKAHQLGFVPAI